MIASIASYAQPKEVGECTLQFTVYQQKQNDSWTEVGQKKVFVKGSQCKTVFTSPYLSQTLIFDTQNDSAAVIKEMGKNAFLQTIKFPPLNLPNSIGMKNGKNDTTIILQGYLCKQMEIQWSDGSLYEIVYTTEIIPTVPNFEMAFKEVPGLVLSYKVKSSQGITLKYEIKKIDLNPITLSQFEINKSLYQIIE